MNLHRGCVHAQLGDMVPCQECAEESPSVKRLRASLRRLEDDPELEANRGWLGRWLGLTTISCWKRDK